MRKFSIIVSLMFVLFGCMQQENEFKLTGINPTSYTAVAYVSSRDTVLATTYSGRIDKVIKNHEKETFAQIDDEIYGITYLKEKNVVAVTTMENGVLVIDLKTGKTTKQLPIKNFWALTVKNNGNFLYARDWNSVTHVWNVQQDYKEVELPQEVSNMILANMRVSQNELLFLSGTGEAAFYDLSTGTLNGAMNTGYKGIVDIDQDKKLLMLLKNECFLYDPAVNETVLTVKHPTYPVVNNAGDLLGEAPVSMTLTAAGFFGDRFFVTGGIDKSLRIWDKGSGTLLKTFTLHSASISGMDISSDNSQMVSVDLKGGINFTESDDIEINE